MLTGILGEKSTRSVQATGTNGNCLIPSEAAGLSLNVTALNATADPSRTRPITDGLIVFASVASTTTVRTMFFVGAGIIAALLPELRDRRDLTGLHR